MKTNLLSPLSLSILVVLSLTLGCRSNPTASEVTLSGRVFNATQLGVRNAAVTLVRQGETTPAFTTTTNDTGAYTVSNVPEGTYTLRITKDGYTPREINLSLNADTRRVDTLTGTANVRGRIINSQTGTGLAGATVSFNFGTDTAEARAELKVITNANGEFTLFNVPAGTFVCIVRAIGFIPQVINNVVFSPTGTTNLPPSTIVQRPPAGSFRIVLTWGAEPRDLDSYLTGPLAGTTNRFVCYFSNRRPSGSNAELDVDDTDGFGPETVTITAFRDGMYRYSVHNYSDQSTNGFRGIASSPARVQVYDNSGLVRDFTAPTPPAGASGNAWRVFEIDVAGTSRTIRPINTYVTGQVGSSTTFGNAPTAELRQSTKKKINLNGHAF